MEYAVLGATDRPAPGRLAAGAVVAGVMVAADDVADLLRPVSADVRHATKGVSR